MNEFLPDDKVSLIKSLNTTDELNALILVSNYGVVGWLKN